MLAGPPSSQGGGNQTRGQNGGDRDRQPRRDGGGGGGGQGNQNQNQGQGQGQRRGGGTVLSGHTVGCFAAVLCVPILAPCAPHGLVVGRGGRRGGRGGSSSNTQWRSQSNVRVWSHASVLTVMCMQA